MEILANCFRCEIISDLNYTFSCGHVLCLRCICKGIVLHNSMIDLFTQNGIKFQCLCNSGSKEFTIDTFQDILLQSHANLICFLHKITLKEYCKLCAKWMCEKCIPRHEEVYSDHILSTKETMKSHCGIHKKEFKEYYCEECHQEICDSCITEISHRFHQIHHFDFYTEKFQKVISFSSQYSDYIDQSSVHLKDKIEFSLNTTLAKFNEIISSLEMLKTQYVINMKRILERTEARSKVMRMICTLLEPEFNKSNKNIDISFYEDLISLHFDFSDLKFEFQDQTEKILSIIKCNIEELKGYIDTVSIPIKIHWNRHMRNTMTLTGHNNSILSLVQMQDGRVASGSGDNTIKLWGPNEKEFGIAHTLKGHNSLVGALLLLRDGRLASGSLDLSIKIWSLKGKEFKNSLSLVGHTNSICSLIQLRDGHVVSGSGDSTIRLWKVGKKKYREVMILIGHTSTVFTLIQLQSDRIASGSADNTIRIWEIKEDEFRNTLTLNGHTSNVRSILQLKDGRIVSGSYDASIKIWESSNAGYNNSLTIQGHTSAVYSILQLQDGRIASGSGDNTIRVWEIKEKNYRNILTLCGHSSAVFCLLQLKDGRIISGSGDFTIRVWDSCFMILN